MVTIRRRSEPSTHVSGVTYEWRYRGWVRTMEVGKLEVYLESEWEEVPTRTWVEVPVIIKWHEEQVLLVDGLHITAPDGYRWNWDCPCIEGILQPTRLILEKRVPHE